MLTCPEMEELKLQAVSACQKMSGAEWFEMSLEEQGLHISIWVNGFVEGAGHVADNVRATIAELNAQSHV